MLLEGVQHQIVEELRSCPEVEVIEGLDFRRAHIRNGEVMIGDFRFSDLDLFFWFGEIIREYDSFDIHLLDAIAQRTIVMNSGAAVRIALDKLLTQLHLHRAGVPIPDFLVVSRENVGDACGAMNGRPYVAKPRLGSFGIGITSVASHDELVDVIDYSEKDIHFLEEFVEAGQEGFIGINVIGRHVVNGYAKEASKYRGWKIFDRYRRGGGVVPKRPTPDQERMALHVAESIGLDVLGVDILTTKEGKHYVIDVNPFPGLYPELNGVAMPSLLVNVILQKLGIGAARLRTDHTAGSASVA
jgi:glutathione synthase/RimK-type ligase-like ATP-grasp enzyme